MKQRSCSKGWLRLWLVMCLLVGLIGVIPIHAQNSRGTILGHITDPSGANVSGAKVTAKNLGTNITNQYTTENTGDYIFLNMVPGLYEVTVEASGFKNVSTTNLQLDVDHTLRQNFSLAVGAVGEQVLVEAQAQMVQSDNASLGNVVSDKLIEDTPLSGRDFTNLLKLQAGATTLKGGSQSYWSLHGLNSEWQGTSINGARSESVGYLIDGVANNDQFFATASSVPGAAAIEEFKLQSGMYSAEYGQGSAQVNVAIKAGTNKYHGTLYDYFQDDSMQKSNPYTAWKNKTFGTDLPTKPSYKQHQFGGSLGGPVEIPHLYNGTNKTFFFGNYEYGLNRTDGISSVLVPSDKERNGDFSDWGYQLYDPATTGQAAKTASNPYGRLPFINNQIPTSRFNSVSSNMLKYYPKANATCSDMSTCTSNYNTSLSKPWDTTSLTVRVDQNFGTADKLFYTSIIGEQKFSNPSAMPYTGETKYGKNKLFSLNWQHTFSANMMNEARLGFTNQYFNDGAEEAGYDVQTKAGFQNFPGNTELWGVPNISMSYYQTLGNGNSRWKQNTDSYQFVDNLKIVRGRHTMAMGVDIRRLMADLYDNYGGSGSLNFTGSFTASDPMGTYASTGRNYHGNAFADFLLGYPMGEGSPNPVGSDKYAVRATNWNFFFQDDWRVNSKLTLNLGLRYELPAAYHDKDGNGFSLDTTNGGGYIWHDKNFVDSVIKDVGSSINLNRVRCCVGDQLTQANHKNFAPRIGLAWRPFNTDRFVVRSGYGIFYDIYNRYYDMSQYDANSLMVDAPYDYSGQQPHGYEASPTWTMSNLWAKSTKDYSWFTSPDWRGGAQVNWPKNKSPYTQQWTLDTQYALTPTMLVDVAYVGSHALHQPGYWYFNSAPMPTGAYDACNHYRSAAEAPSECLSDPNFSPVSARKPFANLSATAYANANIFNSNYNALQVRLTQRYMKGLQYSVNYTWSRTNDEDSAINNQDGESEFLQNQHALKGDYGPANFDQTHRLVFNGTYELPFGKGKRWSVGKLNSVLGGWQVGGLFSVSSGSPFTIYTGGNGDGRTQAGTRNDIIRPNLVGDPSAAHQTIYNWFNTAAYQAGNIDNSYGNVGRNTVRGPYYMKTDLSLGKEFRIKEEQSFQYKVEVFNAGSTWHAVPPTPSHYMTDSNFGSLVPLDGSGSLSLKGANGAQRTIQMDFKYRF